MGRKVMNLVGKKFGKLTVKKEIEERQNNAVQWLCECECGNETIVTGNNLKSGNIKSCGECNHRNLVGKRFGNWIVIEKAPNGKNYQTRWLCECQCELHTRKIIAEQNLIKGLSNGCGCLMLKDLTGEIFGNLLVLKRLPNTENGYVQYQCQCLCENQTIVNVLATNLQILSQKASKL